MYFSSCIGKYLRNNPDFDREWGAPVDLCASVVMWLSSSSFHEFSDAQVEASPLWDGVGWRSFGWVDAHEILAWQNNLQGLSLEGISI